MYQYKNSLTDYARKNRKTGNISEVLLWKKLKQKKTGYSFTKQKPIGNYIADFYCKELNIIIEIDGHSLDTKLKYDIVRDEYMNSLGIKIIHVTDIDVKRDINFVMDMILKKFPRDFNNTLPADKVGTPPPEGN